MKKIYLDYAATSPCDPEVLRAMEPFFFEKSGNASSMHAWGQEAQQALEKSRETLASFLGAEPEEIVFTSGGTESNNLALYGRAFAMREKGNHIITSAIEHHAVTEPAQFLRTMGFEVSVVGVDRYGMVSCDDVRKAVTEKTILISVMHANNEIGTIQPIAEIGSWARQKGICFHTDAVQTVGHIDVNVKKLNVDLLSLSAHKFYGPKGVGALYIRKGTRLTPIMRGGDQERGRRASTVNTPGIVGLGKAVQLCRESMAHEAIEQSALRDKIIAELTGAIGGVVLNGHPKQRLPNNVNLSFKFIEGESILLNLDMLGIAVSTGSACTSSSLEPSHVLLALGLSHEVAHGSLRISLGRWTTAEEVGEFLKHLPPIVKKLRDMSPLFDESKL